MKALKLIFTPLAMVAFAGVLVFSSCKDDDDDNGGSGNPGANEVWMENTQFNPSPITILKDSSVTWTNKDGMNHNVTSSTGLFTSGVMTDGATFTWTFDSVGTYQYTCTLHAGMTGTVIVQ